MTKIMFREKADNVSYVDHEARVFQDVVLGGPAQLRKSSEPGQLNEQELTHAAKFAFWESEVVDLPECTSINRGEEVELDVDPAVVVVLALI